MVTPLEQAKNKKEKDNDTDEDKCEELHTKCQSVFTLQDTEVPLLPVTGLSTDFTSVKPVEMRRFIKALDPYKAHEPHGISQSVLRVAESFAVPLVMLLRLSSSVDHVFHSCSA